jgi:glycosyltransferase involved in cell wall biosynthesis
MRIVFTAPGYKPAWRIGGPVASVSALAEGLVRRGDEVLVLTSNSNLDEDLDVPIDRPVELDGVRVIYLRRSQPLKKLLPRVGYFAKSMGFLYSPRLRQALDAAVPHADLVHTHLPFAYQTYAGARAAFRHRKPFFYHQRGVLGPHHLAFRSLKKRAYLALLEKPLLRRATTLIALTEAEVRSYRQLGLSVPCAVVPNGIDARAFDGSCDHRFFEQWGIRPGHSVVLFLGRVHPTKGADLLLEAFARISAAVPDARLILAGPDEFELAASFRSRAHSLGLAQRVVFPGLVHGEAKRQLLLRADLFCLPSLAEGFSMAVLEALAARCAVLLSPGCNFPEVQAAGAGLVVPRDAHAIATSLQHLLSAPECLRQMGEQGRALVQSQYSWEQITDRMVEVYQEGIERHRAAAQGRHMQRAV